MHTMSVTCSYFFAYVNELVERKKVPTTKTHNKYRNCLNGKETFEMHIYHKLPVFVFENRKRLNRLHYSSKCIIDKYEEQENVTLQNNEHFQLVGYGCLQPASYKMLH